MPEIRVDPLSGDRVIVAGERLARPGGGFSAQPPMEIEKASDPFAEGNESATPPELYSVRQEGTVPNSPGWRVRVVRNLYPALSQADGASPPQADAATVETSALLGPPPPSQMFASTPAIGAHEVIVNSPRQVHSLAQLSPQEVLQAMEVWRARMLAHSQAPCLQLIVNERPQAGASLLHTHAQLYSLPFVPAAIARERERFNAYSTRTMGQDLLSDLLQQEVRLKERIIAIDSEGVLIAPYASKLPYQMMLIPRSRRPCFQEEGPLCASLLHQGLSRLSRLLSASPPLNLSVRTAPLRVQRFCWRIDIMPRLTHLAGLELSTGVNINIVPPERAAAELRQA